MFGYIAIGIPFGLMMNTAGFSICFSVLMSVVMYAGAGQYLAVGLFAANASLGSILAAMLLLNIRHCVYGLSLINEFKSAGKWKPYLIFALSDETYALLTTHRFDPAAGEPAENQGSFYGLIALLNQLYWIAGTAIGGLAGSLLDFSFEGVDFALTALFAVLLIEQIIKTKEIFPVITGAAVTLIVFLFVPAAHVLLVSLAAGICVLMITKRRSANGLNI